MLERRVTLSEWRDRNDGAFLFGEIPAEDEEFAPPDALAALAPDEEHFHEATGNEGASFERTYRRASLVLWPNDRRFAVLSKGGLRATLPYLDHLVRRWTDSAAAQQPPLAAAAHDLAGKMIAHWPSRDGYPRDDEAPSQAAHMLDLLTRLGDTAAIERFLQEVVAGGRHAREDNAAIVGALEVLTPNLRFELVDRIVAGTTAVAPAACADLLARLAATAWSGRRAGPRMPQPGSWRRCRGDPYAIRRCWLGKPGPRLSRTSSLLCSQALMPSMRRLRLARRRSCPAWPATYSLDRAIMPVLRRLANDERRPDHAGRCATARGRAWRISGRELRSHWRRPPTGGGRASFPAAARGARTWARSQRLALKTWIFKARRSRPASCRGDHPQSRQRRRNHHRSSWPACTASYAPRTEPATNGAQGSAPRI